VTVVVVGAAIIAIVDGLPRVLAGERSSPAELAGRWEFPGGKVEAGETDEQALVRECREELRAEISVGARLGPDLAVAAAGAWILRVFVCRLVDGSPVAVEHALIRWLAADELDSVPWLGTNRPLLEPLRVLLRISS
jgi:8-oxo-dGTP diphosphatase